MDSISLEEQWVVFRKGEVQGHTHHSKPPYRVVNLLKPFKPDTSAMTV